MDVTTLKQGDRIMVKFKPAGTPRGAALMRAEYIEPLEGGYYHAIRLLGSDDKPLEPRYCTLASSILHTIGGAPCPSGVPT